MALLGRCVCGLLLSVPFLSAGNALHRAHPEGFDLVGFDGKVQAAVFHGGGGLVDFHQIAFNGVFYRKTKIDGGLAADALTFVHTDDQAVAVLGAFDGVQNDVGVFHRRKALSLGYLP